MVACGLNRDASITRTTFETSGITPPFSLKHQFALVIDWSPIVYIY
jgi:hypothetical protein